MSSNCMCLEPHFEESTITIYSLLVTGYWLLLFPRSPQQVPQLIRAVVVTARRPELRAIDDQHAQVIAARIEYAASHFHGGGLASVVGQRAAPDVLAVAC